MLCNWPYFPGQCFILYICMHPSNHLDIYVSALSKLLFSRALAMQGATYQITSFVS